MKKTMLHCIWHYMKCGTHVREQCMGTATMLDEETEEGDMQKKCPSIPTTLSNNINNNILTFENDLVDQIPEAENFQPSTILEIIKIITNLKQSNSVGWDNIPIIILKSHINILAPIPSNLIRGSSPSLSKELKYCPYLKIKTYFI